MRTSLLVAGLMVPTLFVVAQPEPAQQLPWLETLAEGFAQAQKRREPVLVRVGGESCSWCRKLDGEIAKASVQEALAGWTLVYLDADKAGKDARTLSVSAIPALRLLTANGQTVASQDGYLPAEKLIAWLKEHREEASAPPLTELNDKEELTPAGASKLIQLLRKRDAALREAVVRRLLPNAEVAASPTIEAFTDGNLQLRLALLELLQSWKAPTAGIDPWRPETVIEGKLKPLHAWAAKLDPNATKSPEALSPDALANVRQELARMLQGTSVEASANRERLARHGKALLPEVYDQLKLATTDQARERLTALRYRLVCSEALALNWPIGLEQLAATAAAVRHLAVNELARRATVEDEALLLELFSDPDAQVREISLRALHELGGSAGPDALTRLLADPEPNVRAAVLKQLVERPAASLVPKITEYAQQEKDVDLVVHAVRVLRFCKTKSSVAALQKLLAHESWRVRAEAVEALGEGLERFPHHHGQDGANVEQQAEIYAALLELLRDPDGFVVSRAVSALKYVDLVVAVEPLAGIVEKHPDLAATAIQALAQGATMRAKALPLLKKFCGHADPQVRAAAIASYLPIAGEDAGQELRAALKDADSKARRAACDALFDHLARNVPSRMARAYNVSGLAVPGERASASDDEPDPDAELAKARTKIQKAEWTKGLVELLSPMLAAEAREERLAAARPLVALGQEFVALPVLLTATEQEPALLGKAAQVLVWQPWAERQALFQQFVARKPAADQLADVIQALVQINDRRAVAALWALTTTDQLAHEPASALLQGLNQLYFGDALYQRTNHLLQIPAAAKKKVVREVKPRAAEGPVWQRLIALALLLTAAPEEAGQIAEKLCNDPTAAVELRRDAFQILLVSQSKAERRKTALAALARPEKEIRQFAMKFLIQGGNVLHYLRGDLTIYPESDDFYEQYVRAANQAITLDPPRGVTPEVLRPLLKDTDPFIVAGAGYLLTLLQQPDGLEPLKRHWQEHRNDATWQRLLYRAVTALDDDRHVRLLEEIYHLLPRSDLGRLSEFYWTIRSLEGPAALRLRKQIRQEVGMDNLRAGSFGAD